ncbi:MAG TPA: hypothetical protein VLA55_02910, partial [Ornithinibacter sp.]|nr:hypothetical protein [Ornithinibacter sp.]
SGCGVVPERVEAWTAGEVTKPALTAAEAPTLFEDYDRRNNAAIVETAKSGDPKAWANADTEVVLDHAQFSTHLASLRNDKTVHGTMTHTADQLWAPEFAGYPMYAITSSTLAVKGEKALAPDYRHVSLWLRSSSTAPWLLAGSAGTTTALPRPLPASEGAAPTADDRAQAKSGAEAIMAYLRTAELGKVTTNDALRSLAEGRSFDSRSGHKVTVDWYHPGAEAQVGIGGSVRAVRVSGGVLAHVSLLGRETYDAKEGGYVSWNDPDYAEALGELGVLERLSRDIGVSVVYLVAPDQSVRVLASNWDVVG